MNCDSISFVEHEASNFESDLTSAACFLNVETELVNDTEGFEDLVDVAGHNVTPVLLQMVVGGLSETLARHSLI